jgi:hypothetical protein
MRDMTLSALLSPLVYASYGTMARFATSTSGAIRCAIDTLPNATCHVDVAGVI